MTRSTNLTATVSLAQIQCGARVTFKGAKDVINLFQHIVDEWYRVGEVCNILRAQGVFVGRDTLRAGLNQLVSMGFLESSCPRKTTGAATKYRRKLDPEQREFREMQRKKARNAMVREKIARMVSARDVRATTEKSLQDF